MSKNPGFLIESKEPYLFRMLLEVDIIVVKVRNIRIRAILED